jgi:hypothetical protein
MSMGVTTRERAKAQRRSALLHAAAALFAERGFERVSLEDLGAAVGISGPAVRSLQRGYIDAWVGVLTRIHPSTAVPELRIRARATFGLINSTPHSARTSSKSSVRTLLESMAEAALTV